MQLPNEQDPCQNPATPAISQQEANEDKRIIRYHKNTHYIKNAKWEIHKCRIRNHHYGSAMLLMNYDTSIRLDFPHKYQLTKVDFASQQSRRKELNNYFTIPTHDPGKNLKLYV